MLSAWTINIYQEEGQPCVNYKVLLEYVRNLLPDLQVRGRKDIFQEALGNKPQVSIPPTIKEWALRLASLKIVNPAEEEAEYQPLPAEVEFEIKKLSTPEKIRSGPLCRGLGLMEFFSELISETDSPQDVINIVFTNRLFATWDENDRRYHARVSVYSFLSLISTAGIVEGPAKPREFYLKLRMGLDREELKQEFAGRFLDYDDSRLTEVLKGYILQAIFFHFRGEPFCSDPNCRLYNAHFQEEVLQAQLYSPYEFCLRHFEILKLLNSGKNI